MRIAADIPDERLKYKVFFNCRKRFLSDWWKKVKGVVPEAKPTLI